MPRENGHRLTNGARRRAIRTLASLVAAGIPDDEAREEVAQRFDVTARTARFWLEAAYRDMAKDAEVDRRLLVGSALRTRRLILARAMKNSDFKLALACADSISRLAGLDMPSRTELSVVTEQVADVTAAMTETIREYFTDDVERTRFVQILRSRVNSTLQRRKNPKLAIEVDPAPLPPEAIEAGDGEAVEASDGRADAPTADVSRTAAPAPGGPPPA